MKARNLKTITAYRNQELKIDLGKVFEGELSAAMSRDIDDKKVVEFTILDNRFLTLTKEQTADGNTSLEDEVLNKVEGRWYFDVKQCFGDDCSIIYTGTIFFINNITP